MYQRDQSEPAEAVSLSSPPTRAVGSAPATRYRACRGGRLWGASGAGATVFQPSEVVLASGLVMPGWGICLILARVASRLRFRLMPSIKTFVGVFKAAASNYSLDKVP